MVFGWAHGLGFVGLCILIWFAAIRREAPYTLLAATLTPVGPVGSVIGIELIERKGGEWPMRPLKAWIGPKARPIDPQPVDCA